MIDFLLPENAVLAIFDQFNLYCEFLMKGINCASRTQMVETVPLEDRETE